MANTDAQKRTCSSAKQAQDTVFTICEIYCMCVYVNKNLKGS